MEYPFLLHTLMTNTMWKTEKFIKAIAASFIFVQFLRNVYACVITAITHLSITMTS